MDSSVRRWTPRWRGPRRRCAGSPASSIGPRTSWPRRPAGRWRNTLPDSRSGTVHGTPSAGIRLTGVGRVHPSGAGEIWALREVSMVIEPGESVAVTGPSGSGKSTLLNLIGGLDRSTHGQVQVFGHRLDTMRERALT